MSDAAALSVGPEDVSFSDIWLFSKRHQMHGLFQRAAQQLLVSQHAADRGIIVGDEDLQDYADEFRRQRGLLDTDDLYAWLEAHGISVDAWEKRLEEELLWGKVRDLVTLGDDERYFAGNAAELAGYAWATLLVEDEGIARELHLLIIEEQADFFSLAAQYSIEPGAGWTGGKQPVVPKSQLPVEVANALAGRELPCLLEPMEVEQGWLVVHIDHVVPARLDGLTRDSIRDLLFQQWLDKRFDSVRFCLDESST